MVLALATSGCAWISPGVHVSEGTISSRSTAQVKIEILPVTPQLLVAQAEERARRAAARPRDPLAAEAQRY